MEQFVFDRDVPVPTTSVRSSKMSRTLAIMEVGDSFLVDGDKDLITIRSSMYQYAKRNGKKFSAYKDVSANGVRVHRIS